MLELFYSPGACSLAAHVLLEELGLPYEAKAVSLKDGAHKQPAFLAINPRGKVPALRIESGEILTENPVILSYLASLAPRGDLVPEGAFAQVRALQYASYLSSEAHPAFARLYMPGRYSGDAAHAVAIRETARRDYLESLQTFQAMLPAEGPYVFGERFTWIDPLVHVFYTWAKYVELDVASLGRLRGLSAAVSARPATRRALVAEGMIAG